MLSDSELHTDISFRSNFLYNPDLKEGVLVDFGLAEVSFGLLCLTVPI